MDEDFDLNGTHEDQYGWKDTEGNSFMLHRLWPNDWRRLDDIEERFLGKPMNVTKAELVCVGQPPVELSLEEAQHLAVEVGLAAWEGGVFVDGNAAWDDNGNPLGGMDEETIRAMTIYDGEANYGSPPMLVNPEDNPMKRACDKDRSIPMG